MNRVTLLGNLVRDAEIKLTDTNKHFTNFTIAVPKRIKPMRKDQPDCDYFSCRAWGLTAEHIGTFGTRGTRVTVDGRLESRRFMDSTGSQRYVVEIIVDTCEIIDQVDPTRLSESVA